MKKIKNPTACIIIIGNEILSGRTIDTNKNYLCKELNIKGIDVIEVRVIKDNIKYIVDTVNQTRKKYDYIFTTGGIGPTHDDLTSLSIAKAFKVKLVKNKKAIQILKKYYSHTGKPINKAQEKMAFIPKGAELLHNPITKAAGFRIKNVSVMAGIPRIMIAMFENLVKKIKHGTPQISKTILVTVSESNIAKGLSRIQHQFKEVEIGSYPFLRKKKNCVNIVLRSKNKNQINEAAKEIRIMIKSL